MPDKQRSGFGIRSALVVLVTVFAMLRFGPGPKAVTADAADALLGGVRVAQHLASDITPRPPIATAFATPAGAITVAVPGRKNTATHQNVAQPPGGVWVNALSILLAPTTGGTPNLQRARTGTAVFFALGLLLMVWLLRDEGWLAMVLAGLTLITFPGAWDVATASAPEALAVTGAALWIAAVQRAANNHAAWWLALCVAIGLMLHPTTIALLIPAYITVAVWRRAAADAAPAGPAPPTPAKGSFDAGALRLPSVRPSLFAAPVLGFALFVAAWPVLWRKTFTGIGTYFVDAYWHQLPAHKVAGRLYHQADDRAPHAWSALFEWAAWCGPAVALAFAIGAAVTIRRWRQRQLTPPLAALLFALLMWLTLVIAGGLDGGLFGARLSLLAWLWVPTALLAALGAAFVLGWLRGRITTRPVLRKFAVAGAVVILFAQPVAVLLGLRVGQPIAGSGAIVRRPLPIALLQAIDRAETGVAKVAMAHDGPHWRPTFEAAARHTGRDLVWSDAKQADWVIVVGDTPQLSEPEAAPALAGSAYGVTFVARRAKR